MSPDVLLVSAPVMSVLRPSVALGLLQASLHARRIGAESLYLNLVFAETIGVDRNEGLAAEVPNHLLIGDWLFAQGLGGTPNRPEVATHRAALETFFRDDMARVLDVRERVVPDFVARAADQIVARGPRIVGFSTMFEQTVASLVIAARVRQIDPSIVICFGGANCHGPMGATLLRYYPQIDFVFTGEADLAFPEFVGQILATGDASGIDGCLGRDSALRGRQTPLMRMDILPVPDYGDYHRQLARMTEAGRIVPSTPFESSRGCWWGQKHHCTFCGLNAEGMVYRVKSPGRVIDELETLHNAHGGTAFAATDNIISQSHVKSVLVALANRPPTGNPWRLFYEIKSNTGEDDLRTMARAGVIWVQPGIESLSDAALRLMRKGVSALLNIRLLRNCLEFGMGVTWSIIYGFPGEPSDTYDEAAALVPMIEHLYPPIGCVRIRLDRFSPNFERAAEIGFHDVVPCVSYAAIHDIPGEALRDLAYFFEGHAPDAVREENVERLRLAVTEWRATWFDAALTPQLTMIDVGEGHLIKDTRRCAVEPLYFATAIEGAVLGLLRSPCRAASLGGRLATDYSADAIERALANLRARKFVIEIGGECLSLVCEAGRELFDAEDRSRFPAGYLLPLAAE